MIRRLVIALIIFIAYYGAARLNASFSDNGAANFNGFMGGSGLYGTNQSNVITAMNWKHRKTNPDTVIIGTSKSKRLLPQYFKRDLYNLGMSGNGSGTGLRILSQSNYVPKLILVEVSSLSAGKEQDEEVIAAAKGEPSTSVFTTIGIDARPINVLFGLANRVIPEPDYKSKLVMRMQDSELRFFRKHLNAVKRTKLIEQTNELKRLICELQSRGAKVILFDVPMDPRVISSPNLSDGQEIITQLLPESEFDWLPVANGQWQTSDLVHLTYESSQTYAEALENELQAKLATKPDRTY